MYVLSDIKISLNMSVEYCRVVSAPQKFGYVEITVKRMNVSYATGCSKTFEPIKTLNRYC